MRNISFKTVNEYIAAQPPAAQVILECVRKTIRKALPNAEEGISYNIPVYKQHTGVLLFFAGWKRHFSLYPAGEDLVAAFKEQLASYKISKGTIRFPLSEPVPVKLIEGISKFRTKEAVQGASKTSVTSKGRTASQKRN